MILPGATLNLNNSAAVDLSQRRLENAGLVVWTGTGDFQCQNGPVLTNVPGGIWEVRNNQSFVNTYGTSPRFDNAGIFRKITGTGTTTFNTFYAAFPFPFNNYGMVDFQTGTLEFKGQFNHSGGPITIPSGSVLRLSGGGTATGV